MFDPAGGIAEVQSVAPMVLSFALVLVGTGVVLTVGWFLLSQFWNQK